MEGVRDTTGVFREVEAAAAAVRQAAQSIDSAAARVAQAAEEVSVSTLRMAYLTGLRDGATACAVLAALVCLFVWLYRKI